MKPFFSRAVEVIRKSYTGKNLLLQGAAILLTYIIVASGFDWFYFLSVRNESLNALFFPALPVGFFFPILLPAILLAVGYLSKKGNILKEGVMLSYAAFLSWFVSSTYKAFTGRVQPNLHNLSLDSSRDFNFGFFEHGIFWGWPSSHTAVAFATMTTLFLITPKKSWVRWAAIIYAFYIGIGVSLSIHWFSEFVSGALIGTAIGLSVEETWRKKNPEVLYWKHMKNSIIAVIIIVVLLLVGAYAYVAKNKAPVSSATTSGMNGSASATPTLPTATPGSTTVHITSVDKVPASSQLVYKGSGTDSIAIEVKGSIKNVKLVAVELNGPELSLKDTIKEFGDVKDSTIYITTTIPEGVPTQMLTWQSNNGATYSWIIGANGTTGSIDRTYNGIE